MSGLLGQPGTGDLSSVADRRPNQTFPIRRRPWWARISGAHVAMVLAGALALLLNLSLLRNDDLIEVASVRSAVEPGSEFVASMVAWVEVESTTDLAAPLVVRSELGNLLGRIVSAPLAAGDLVVESLLNLPAAPSELRSFSIPVAPAHAVGGDVSVGDIVDVIATVDGVARYVAIGAPVLSVPSTERRGLAGPGDFFVVVAVDADTALILAGAIESSAIDLVVSTGAPTPNVTALSITEGD